MLPENSLLTLKTSLEGTEKRGPIQFHRNFVYLEFDVRETADHELVVSHDSSLRRTMCGARSFHRVDKMTLNQIQAFHFRGYPQERIATLEEFFEAAIDFQLRKPMVIEIKNIHSLAGWEKLLQLVDRYREQYANASMIYVRNFDFPREPVTLMAFPGSFQQSYGGKYHRSTLNGLLNEHKIQGIFRAHKHGVNLTAFSKS